MTAKTQNRRNIFIPFIDGLLSYNCKDCGYDCCQMGNLIMNIKEKIKLIKMYPYLRYFFYRETNKAYGLRKYPRCWFLENNGLCSIQKEFGYSYKPFICRLHPFYIARCKDEYIVMTDSCPALYVGKGNKDTSHKQILKNCQEAIDYDCIQGQIDLPVKRLDLERKILKDSKSFLGNLNYLDFCAYQIAISTKNKNIAEIKSALLEAINLWKSFLGIDRLNLNNKRLTYELTAITSLLRVESPLLRQMQAEKVPLALLALYFYMPLFTKCREPKTYVQTYEQILSDIALGLIFLEKSDLKIKYKSLEDKISYLRKLQMLTALKRKMSTKAQRFFAFLRYKRE